MTSSCPWKKKKFPFFQQPRSNVPTTCKMMTFLYLQSKTKIRNCCTLLKSIACSFRAVSSILNLLRDSAFDPFSHLSFLNVSFGWSHFQLDFNPISKWKLYSTDVPACSVQPIVWSPRSEQINLDCVCRFLESKLSFFYMWSLVNVCLCILYHYRPEFAYTFFDFTAGRC